MMSRFTDFFKGYGIPFLLFVFLVVVYNLNARIIAGSDVYSTRIMPINLIKYGTYYLGGIAAEGEKEDGVYQGMPTGGWNLGTRVYDPESPSHGRVISVYPTYTPTLLVPLYYYFYSENGLNLPVEHALTMYMDKWIATVIAALTGVLLFSLVRRMHEGKNLLALLVTLGMSLGTSIWAISSQGSWAMGPSALYLILSVWAMERAVRLIDSRLAMFWAILSGWAIASAFATRLTDIFFVLPFFIFGLWELRSRRSFQIAFFLGIVPVALWFMIHNYVYFDNPLTTGYKYNMAQQRVHNLMHRENFFGGFFGLLFSPSIGLIPNAPVVLFAIPGFLTVWYPRFRVTEKRSDGSQFGQILGQDFIHRAMRLCIVFVILHILFYSNYLEWWGGWSYVYRYLIDILPFVFLGVGWFLRPQARWAKYRWPLFIPALLFSILIQFFGAFFWGGTFYSALNTEAPIHNRLYVDLRPDKEADTRIFNRESILFSMKRKDHLVFREKWPNWMGVRDGFFFLERNYSRVKMTDPDNREKYWSFWGLYRKDKETGEIRFGGFDKILHDFDDGALLPYHPHIIYRYGDRPDPSRLPPAFWDIMRDQGYDYDPAELTQ